MEAAPDETTDADLDALATAASVVAGDAANSSTSLTAPPGGRPLEGDPFDRPTDPGSNVDTDLDRPTDPDPE